MPDTDAQLQQAVFDLLHRLDGIDPLKQLFWSELNYDRVSRSLPRRGWPDATSTLLADDPLLLASAADDFHVIYARLAKDELLMGDERSVVTRLLQDHPYALFIFSNAARDQFHFLNVKYENEAQKRRLFRRITVGPYERLHERLRTASECIASLDVAGIPRRPLEIQKRHDDAFDVEPVQKKFFSEYHRIFTEVEESITGFGRDKDHKRLYTQRLFNRLMFIAFIQKKAWLKLKGDTDYLAALWKAHLGDKFSNKNFYRDRLKNLFFLGLNTSNEVNIIGINRGGGLKDIIGNVPYLNGGLFEEDEDDKNDEITVPDKALGAVLNGLFSKFNFTVTESTPLDVEVAVDPEMLGKIFEELVTGRHESGSYYTPKTIVSFMCREALKGYLVKETPTETRVAIARFVEEHHPDGIKNPEKVLDALRKIRVCDPACGSGAYLLGMLHELLDLRHALFQSRQLDAKSVYARKLEIIQTNIYGVDIDPFAVNIARLRLWLSLAVDFEGNNPEPLPNLDYKLEVGDSLGSVVALDSSQFALCKSSIDEYLAAKAEYLVEHHGRKIELKQKVEKLRTEVKQWLLRRGADPGFSWIIDFAEVFLAGGFDIVVGNPPYISVIQSDKLEGLRDAVRSRFQTAVGAFDIYIPFYELSAQIVRESGWVSLITPNKVLSAEYAKALRKYLTAETSIQSLLDAAQSKPFGAAVYPVVVSFRKERPTSTFQVEVVRAERSDGDIVITPGGNHSSDVLSAFDDNLWSPLVERGFDLLVDSLTSSKRLDSVCTIRQSASVDEAYHVFKPLLSEGNGSKSKSTAKFIISGTIDRYRQMWGKPISYLKSRFVKPVLKLDPDVLSEERLHQIRNPKVIISGQALYPKAFYDSHGSFASGIPTVLLYDSKVPLGFLCALVNSRVYRETYRLLWSTLAMSGGYLRFGPPQLRRMPIPAATDRIMQKLDALTVEIQELLSGQSPDTKRIAELEGEIDAKVFELFNIEESEFTRTFASGKGD